MLASGTDQRRAVRPRRKTLRRHAPRYSFRPKPCWNNAKLDAKRILDEANAKAEAVLSKANNDADTLKSNAQREADQLRGEAQKAVVAQRQTVDLELTNSP